MTRNALDAKRLMPFLEQVLATAQAGLTYSRDRFDIERFHRLERAAAELIASGMDHSPEHVLDWIRLDSGYPTPKIDVRAIVIDRDERVLLVREASDGLWTLPGGWCDINESPADAAMRETREETGLIVRAVRLLAVFDKNKHAHPPQIPHAIKFFFLCEVEGGTLSQSTDETTAAAYHEWHALPALSMRRVLPEQIRLLCRRAAAGELETVFD